MSVFKKNLEHLEPKTNYSLIKIILLSIMGGMFISLGYIGYFEVGQYALKESHNDVAHILFKFFGALIFPAGLIACVFMGGSLFTSDSLLSIAWYKKKIKAHKLMINWTVVWIFNFIGSSITAVIAYLGGVFDSPTMSAILNETASHKADAASKDLSIGWLKVTFSGILCNLLVAGAIFMVNNVDRPGAKIALIWFPIALFVMGGFQHTVANQFVFVAAWMKHSPGLNTTGAILNLLFSGIGNWIAGAVIIPLTYGLIEHFSLKKAKEKVFSVSIPEIDAASTIKKPKSKKEK